MSKPKFNLEKLPYIKIFYHLADNKLIEPEHRGIESNFINTQESFDIMFIKATGNVLLS